MSFNNYPFNYGYIYPQGSQNRNLYASQTAYGQQLPCQTNLCNQCVQPNNYTTNVSYITTIPTATTIPPGLAAPTGTVTPITGYSTTPTTNLGNVTLNGTNGQFTLPVTGRYIVTTTIGFNEASAGLGANTGTRQVYIYRVDGTTGSLMLLAEDSRNAVTTGNTYISLATTADFTSGDRVFVAATQSNTATPATSISTTTDGRFTITRLC